MGILEDIESGIGLAPSPTLGPTDAPAPLLEDPLYSGANGVDAAAPIGSAAQAAAQSLAQRFSAPSSTPLATVPGWTTKNIQQDLNRLGALPRLVEDGKPGPKTTAALKAFQNAHGLVADGKIGPKTEAAITAALAGPPEPFVVPAASSPVSKASAPAPAPSPAALADPLLGGKPPVARPKATPATAAVAAVKAVKPTNVKAVMGVGLGVVGALALAAKAHLFGGR